MMLKIKDLKVKVENHEILRGISLEVNSGEFHVLMGPNGSGKSTLAQVLMGSPNYKVISSRFTVNGKDISKLTADKRAKLGIFLGFQHPVEIPGVSVFNVLRKAAGTLSNALSLGRPLARDQKSLGSFLGTKDSQNSVIARSRASSPRTKLPTIPQTYHPTNLSEFREQLLEYASSLMLSNDFLRRSMNEGFSGGEKKRNEILQMMVLKPKLAILDEIDSGLDVDGLKIIADSMNRFMNTNKQSSVLLITHYARILKYLKPDFVHVMVEGRIVKSGKMGLAKEIEEKGYRLVNS